MSRTIRCLFFLLTIVLVTSNSYKLPKYKIKKQYKLIKGDETWVQPRYSGQLISEPGSNNVYLVMYGRRYRVPNTETYQNLFRPGTKIKKYNPIVLRSIAKGSIISDGAMLATSPNDNGVYLITNGARRQIMTKEAFEEWNFNSKRVVVIPDFVLHTIPRGKFIDINE